MTADKQKIIRHTITQLLSRREHGFYELSQKLAQKGYQPDDTLPILEQFQQADIQSDSRFAEMHLRSAVQKGQGLVRVKQTLRQLQVDERELELAVAENAIDWFTLALEVKQKKFGFEPAQTPKEQAKQQRFLQYRGFSYEEIHHALTTRGDP